MSGMIHKPELDAIAARAHAVRMTMAEVCKRAGKHRQSWHRAYKRGKAEYTLIWPLEQALDAIEKERT